MNEETHVDHGMVETGVCRNHLNVSAKRKTLYLARMRKCMGKGEGEVLWTMDTYRSSSMKPFPAAVVDTNTTVSLFPFAGCLAE